MYFNVMFYQLDAKTVAFPTILRYNIICNAKSDCVEGEKE